jgi:predicted alpha-1,2-mannosidase
VGGCTQDYGSMTLMTVTGTLKTQPEQRASVFSHQHEVATPSYYAVRLDSYQALAEMTGKSRTAMFRFTYDKGGMAYLVVNPNSDEGEGFIEIDLQRKEIRGYNPVHRIYQGWGERAGFSGYFVIKFEHVPCSYGVYQEGNIYSKKLSIGNAEHIGAFVGFKVKAHEQLLVKAASSFTGIAGARINMAAEIPHWNFNLVRKALQQVWQSQLSKVVVKGDNDEQKKFYSALYRTSFLPHVFNDVDGKYPAFSKGQPIRQAVGHDYYVDYSAWDTYRALHPLLTIIDTKRDADMVQSLIDKYKAGGWLPIFPCWNSYTAAMIGDHCISIIGDALMKDIKGIDVATAYQAMRQNAFCSPDSSSDYQNGKGRRALKSYLKYGYVPLEDSVKEAFHQCEQVSRTLEYAYDDYVLAQVAGKLGKTVDSEILLQRAANYKNVIDTRSGYAQGRYADGRFLTDNNAFSFARFVTEGAPCHYTWYVPQDIKGLMKWMGGRANYSAKLDSMFTAHRYWHGNEPCHQIPYLFCYSGEAWKTQQWVNYIRQTEYLNAPGGLSGNDDAGQMSAWYVFAALGFYPVCPGNPYYVIGTPAFSEAKIALPGGKSFIIRARNVSASRIYIQSAKLNGKVLDKSYLWHKQIMQGGVLEFEMGDKPNTLWASKEGDCPPSMSDKR